MIERAKNINQLARKDHDMLIVSAAHFLVCDDCKNHGWIVLSDGSKGDDCASKRQAKARLEMLVSQEMIAQDELPELGRQIDASTLPDLDEARERVVELELRVDSIEEMLMEEFGSSESDDADPTPPDDGDCARGRTLN